MRLACLFPVLFATAALGQSPTAATAPALPAPLPVPDAAALARAAKEVAETYHSDFAYATTPELKHNLAIKFLDTAPTTTDPAVRLVLYRNARDLAAQVGSINLANKVIAATTAAFAVDPSAEKLPALSTLATTAHTASAHEQTVRTAVSAMEEAILADRTASARRLADIALQTARHSDSPALAEFAGTAVREQKAVETALTAAAPAMAALQKAPTDPAASLTAGRFLCFMKGDWSAGLPLLAQSNDPTLKPLAQRSLALRDAETADADTLAALADAWWDLAEKEAERPKHMLRRHAAALYHHALPKLTGLPETKAQKRLAALAEMEAPKHAPKPPPRSHGN